MSHTLTEVDIYTPSIVVPDGTDSRNDAAGDVQEIAQALANRTHSLQLHGARADGENTWEQPQTFDIDQANDPAIRTSTHAGDHGGSPGNIWKSQFEFLLTDGTYARVYSGAGGVDGNWAITTNAEWNPDAGLQHWHKDIDAGESNILRAFNGELHWYGRAPGPGTWGTSGWTTTRGVMRIGDGLHATELLASIFKYEAPQPRWIQLFPEGGFNHDVSFGLDRVRLAAAEFAIYRIKAPTGAVLGQVNVKVQEYTGCQYEINLFKTIGYDSAAATVPVTSSVQTVTYGPGGTSVLNKSLNYGGLAVNNEAEHYWVRVLNWAGSPVNLDVWAVQFSYADPGPRNH